MLIRIFQFVSPGFSFLPSFSVSLIRRQYVPLEAAAEVPPASGEEERQGASATNSSTQNPAMREPLQVDPPPIRYEGQLLEEVCADTSLSQCLLRLRDKSAVCEGLTRRGKYFFKTKVEAAEHVLRFAGESAARHLS